MNEEREEEGSERENERAREERGGTVSHTCDFNCVVVADVSLSLAVCVVKNVFVLANYDKCKYLAGL